MNYYFKIHCTNFPLGERFDSFYGRLANKRALNNMNLPESGHASNNSKTKKQVVTIKNKTK